ncbi:tetratricopeptide repeat protein [Streptomyces sp. NPDC057638]|uniref:tetratricopeptide repeat protein n=1 Tax=Streptomyces sp. NPDC057638 TaxID=3346190 RepID=UPI00369005C1
MASPSRAPTPNPSFRKLRGRRSPAEFAALVRKAGREIGENVSCDARYIGRVESGAIRCPNYAYERVFLHMFPGLSLLDLGFTARERVRGRGRTPSRATPPGPAADEWDDGPDAPRTRDDGTADGGEETDVLRRAFMTSGSATVAASFGLGGGIGAFLLTGAAEADTGPARGAGPPAAHRPRVGATEAAAVEAAVRRIRLLDDRHGADGLYQRAAQPLRAAYALLDAGISRRATAARLHSGAGELALSVGWLAHDSGRHDEARSHYTEALATARAAADPALEAHAFSNISFLARDAGRYREAVRAAEAGQRAAREVGSPWLHSLLALREAGGWAGLGDRAACERGLTRARGHFDRGDAAGAPAWMSFFGEPEMELLRAQCWSALGDFSRAAQHAHRAAALQDPRFTRNLALCRAELALDLARGDAPDAAGAAGHQVLDLLDGVRSARIESMLATTARHLRRHRPHEAVHTFLRRHAA